MEKTAGIRGAQGAGFEPLTRSRGSSMKSPKACRSLVLRKALIPACVKKDTPVSPQPVSTPFRHF